MPVVALITWIVTALGGLYLLAIWLIEYDPDFQRAAATRLPVPVISGHVLFAIGGLAVWLMYLITDEDLLPMPPSRSWPLSPRSALRWRFAGSASTGMRRFRPVEQY